MSNKSEPGSPRIARPQQFTAAELDAFAEAHDAILARSDDDLAAIVARLPPRAIRRIVEAMPPGLIVSVLALGFTGAHHAPVPAAPNGAAAQHDDGPPEPARAAPARPVADDKQRPLPFDASDSRGAKPDGAQGAKDDGAQGAGQGADDWAPGFLPYTGPTVESTPGREWYDADEEKVWLAVRNSHGVSVSDIARLSGVELNTVKLRVKRLIGRPSPDVFQAGDRRFTRYAATWKEAKEAAERAAKSAKGRRVGQ